MPSNNITTVWDDLQIHPSFTQALEEPLTSHSFAALRKPLFRKATMESDNQGKTFEQLYEFRGLVRRVTDCATFERSKKPKQPMKWVTEDAMIGIEIEVENITTTPSLSPHWNAKQDGSLRNHGMEFVSVPLQIKQVQIALESLYLGINACNQPDFSNRTSTHIHLNIRDMTQDQIKVLIYLYAIFEKHFYSFAGHRRLNSIFCVPIFRTNMLKCVPEVLYSFVPSWHKYCGLNLLPMVNNGDTRGFGTIEFRHLYGTNDPQQILDWINNILCLRKAAMEIKLSDLMDEIKVMNTTSSYMSLYTAVFGEVGHLPLRHKSDFEECVSNLKRELFGRDFVSQVNLTERCVYWDTVRKMEMRSDW